jgi:hypothetical protein
VLAFTGAIIGHSLISGYEQLVMLGVLAAAVTFEAAWRCARGTTALARGLHAGPADTDGTRLPANTRSGCAC